MNEAAANQPATKADLNALESKLDDKFKSIDDKFKSIDDKFKDLSGEILKNNFKIDHIIDRLNTEFATKADINRVFKLLDAITGDIRKYQREDTLRGDAVMRHEEQLASHETRITLLEKK